MAQKVPTGAVKIKDMQRLNGFVWPIPSTAFPADQREADLALVRRTVQKKPYEHQNIQAKIATTLAYPTKLKKINYANLDPESCKVNKQVFNELFYNIVFFAPAVPWSIITAAPRRECSYERSWWTDGRDMKFVYPSLSWDPSACQPATHAGAHARQARTHE